MSTTGFRSQTWRIAEGREISLAEPTILGIINVTPDSFYAGSRMDSPLVAAAAAERMMMEGAAGFDIGGESTRPGSSRVTALEQIARVVPAIRAIRARLGKNPVITVDTTSSTVAAAALDAGADAINDVSAGRDDAGMLTLCGSRRVGLILMHRLNRPEHDHYSTAYSPHASPSYGDVVAVLQAFFRERVSAALAAGVERAGIVIDPGLGFGKTVEQNLLLIERTSELVSLGYPVMSGISRKSFTVRAGRLPGGDSTPPEERLAATVGLSVVHLNAGARLFRVHDVAAHKQSLTAAFSCISARSRA